MLYWIFYGVAGFLRWLYFPTKVIGYEHVPRRGGFILASNHASNLDPFALGIIFPRRVSFIAKDSLFKSKISSFLFHNMGAFPIRRESSDFRAIRETLKRLKKGFPVVIFPEGTRLAAKRTKRVQAGIGLIAVKSGVPVVPTYIEGTDKVLGFDSKWFKRSPITVIIGEPRIYTPEQSYEDIAHHILDDIQFLAAHSSQLKR